jgi:hypothetical protein
MESVCAHEITDGNCCVWHAVTPVPNCECQIKGMITVKKLILGRNPRNGRSPPKDSKDVNIMNFISVASLFVIMV